MKKASILLLFIILFVSDVLAQTNDPLKVAAEFLNLAQKNDLATALRQLNPAYFDGVKRERLKQAFQVISNSGLKAMPVDTIRIESKLAFLAFKPQEKDDLLITINVLLFKTARGWEIAGFETSVFPRAISYSPYSPFSTLPKPKAPLFDRLKPYDPNDNPIQFKEIYPKKP